MTLRCLLLLLAASLVPALAGAAGEQADSKAADAELLSKNLALEAHQVISEQCAQVAGQAITKAAKSVSIVGDVWARVSAQLEATNEVYLLYWRGVLEQCLDQEDRALMDLRSFVKLRGRSELWVGLVRDANRRIRRIERQLGQVDVRRYKGAGVGLGVALAASSGVMGALSAWQYSLAEREANELRTQGHPGAEVTLKRQQMEDYQASHRGLLAVSIGVGLGSAAAFVVGAVLGAERGSVALGAPPVLAPLPGGAVLSWTGRW